jgi:hypothetical protein
VRASAVTLLKKASTWAVVLSASNRFRHCVVAANSSGRHASSEGTGDATVRSGDSGRRLVVVARGPQAGVLLFLKQEIGV